MLVAVSLASKPPVNEPSLPSQADDLDVLALLLGVVLGALLEAVHEDRHGRERQAAVGADDTGLGVVGGGVAGQERRLGGVVEQRLDVGLVGLAVEGLAVVAAVSGVVDEDVLDVGVGGSRLLGRGREREAHGHDGVAALGHEALEVGRVVVLAVGLDGVELDAELVGRLLGALVAELVERLVVETTRVGDDAGQEVERRRGLFAAVASRSAALGRVAAAGQGRGREQGGEAARDGLPHSHHVPPCIGVPRDRAVRTGLSDVRANGACSEAPREDRRAKGYPSRDVCRRSGGIG